MSAPPRSGQSVNSYQRRKDGPVDSPAPPSSPNAVGARRFFLPVDRHGAVKRTPHPNQLDSTVGRQNRHIGHANQIPEMNHGQTEELKREMSRLQLSLQQSQDLRAQQENQLLQQQQWIRQLLERPKPQPQQLRPPPQKSGRLELSERAGEGGGGGDCDGKFSQLMGDVFMGHEV